MQEKKKKEGKKKRRKRIRRKRIVKEWTKKGCNFYRKDKKKRKK